jgi:hypothetical protein
LEAHISTGRAGPPLGSNYDDAMLGIIGDHIVPLNDEDLRALIGQSCAAELRSVRISTASVTWGGDQNASDGGIDVRMELLPETGLDEFILRPNTGFQVKAKVLTSLHVFASFLPQVADRPASRAGDGWLNADFRRPWLQSLSAKNEPLSQWLRSEVS